MSSREMMMDEKIIRQSIATMQEAIDKLCRQRDALAAMLPEAPRPVPVKISPITGKPRSRVPGGGKRKKITNE